MTQRRMQKERLEAYQREKERRAGAGGARSTSFLGKWVGGAEGGEEEGEERASEMDQFVALIPKNVGKKRRGRGGSSSSPSVIIPSSSSSPVSRSLLCGGSKREGSEKEKREKERREREKREREEKSIEFCIYRTVEKKPCVSEGVDLFCVGDVLPFDLNDLENRSHQVNARIMITT